MQISIVMAVFNREKTIEGAVRSVLAQTYQNFELVVQDGGSTDGTLDILHGILDPRLKIVSAPDDGIYDAINKGIKRAQGDVIGLMHSDDFFADTTCLSDIAAAFNDAQVDGTYSDLQYVSNSNESEVVRYWQAGDYDVASLKKGWMPPHPTLYLRRAVYQEFGLYDASFRIAADYEAILRYLTRANLSLAYIPRVLVHMRVGGESNKSLSKIMQKCREDFRAIQMHNIGGLSTLAMKNLSKIQQFVRRVA